MRGCWFLVLLLFGSVFGQFEPDGVNLKITSPGQAIVAVKNSALDMRICRYGNDNERKEIKFCYGADENGNSQGICGNCLIDFTFYSAKTKQYISVTGSNGQETETTQTCLDVELKTNGFTAMGKFYSCTASLVYGNALAIMLKDQLPSFATITLLNTAIAKPQPGSAEILPWWNWLLIAIACLIAVAAGVFFVFVLCKPKEKKKKKKKIPTTVETPEEAARQREAFERAIRKNAEKARMPDLPKNLDKRKFIYGCVTVEAMMFPYWQIKDRLLKRYPPPNEKEYEWNTETILEWFVYFNPLDAYPEEVVEDMPTPDSITRIQDLYHENDLEKAIDAVEVELFSCGPNELVYKFGKLWQDCMETCLKWGMKKREDGTYQLNKNIKERVVKNEGTGRQYRTFMFVQEYINLFTSPKFPKKYDKWPISALYANMFRLDYYPKLVIFMMFSIKVKYLMAVAPYYSADTQNQMAHPIPALRMALENDKDRFMESLLQLKHAMVKFNDKSDSFSEKMSNMIKVLTPKD